MQSPMQADCEKNDSFSYPSSKYVNLENNAGSFSGKTNIYWPDACEIQAHEEALWIWGPRFAWQRQIWLLEWCRWDRICMFGMINLKLRIKRNKQLWNVWKESFQEWKEHSSSGAEKEFLLLNSLITHSDHLPWTRRLRLLLETHCLFSTENGVPLVR